VLAAAGAGKTRVLTLRVARRVADGSAEPARVLVTTFSRRAADELRRRLWLLGVADGPRAGTFHRTALSLVRRHRSDRRLAPVEVLGDRRPLLRDLLADSKDGQGFRRAGPPGRGRGGPAGLTAERLDAEIGWAKAWLAGPDDYEALARDHRRRGGRAAAVAEMYARYEERRRRSRLVDLDDLLWVAGDALSQDPSFAEAVRWRFRHLFVDEMQDVNPAQFRMLLALMGPDPDVFVVGDPHQSIYGWNGADPNLLDGLPELVPGTRVL
jgi:DNA helicase II / ATP-dependent DNA helicase PcrA